MHTEQLDQPAAITPTDPLIAGVTRGAGRTVTDAVIGVLAATMAVIVGAILIITLVTRGSVAVDVPPLDLVDGAETVADTRASTSSRRFNPFVEAVDGPASITSTNPITGSLDGPASITSTNPITGEPHIGGPHQLGVHPEEDQSGS